MKQKLINNIKNIYGWKTKRKIVVLAIDDYGSIRLANENTKNILQKSGLIALNRFDKFDSLENKNDLSALFETLHSVKDKYSNPAIFTAFTVLCNINYEQMAAEGYNEYVKEILPETFKKLEEKDPTAYTGTWTLWQEGIEKKLIYPEFHGREHFNLKVFNEKLRSKDKNLITALKNRSLTSISDTGYPTISFTGAFEFDKFEENYGFQPIIQEGLNAFEKVFGFRARHFNPPGGREHPVIHKFLKNGGIHFLDTPLIKKEHQGNGKYKIRFNYTGKNNHLGQMYMVRNCVFEPTHDRSIDWVNYTFKQVEAAFRWKRPAIISSHRVNFSGHINPKNREKGLTALKELLHKITSKYPEVEFMSSSELGQLINQNDKR